MPPKPTSTPRTSQTISPMMIRLCPLENPGLRGELGELGELGEFYEFYEFYEFGELNEWN